MFEIRYKSHHDVKNIITKLIPNKMVTPFSFNRVMKQKPKDSTADIYVHTPYCDTICSFCNMNRKKVDNNLDSYVQYLCKEFEKYKNRKYVQEKTIDTIFFGGGTPTIYSASQLETILSSLKNNFNISKNCEFTFESTLHNLTPEKLCIMEKYGVNRISIGVQTFSDRGRKLLNRTFDQKEVINRLKDIKKSYSGLICIDIIYNYLDETIEEVTKDAEIAIELGIDSISFYSLMIHKGSKISKDLENNKLSFDYHIRRDKELHNKFLEVTLNNGFSLLELTKITNGKDTYGYIQNINSCKDLIAIGVGAGGRVDNIEYYNMNKLISFYSQDSDFSYKAKKLSGLLQYPKVNLTEIRELTGDDIYPSILGILQECEREDFLEFFENSFKYTVDGIFWGNTIAAAIITKMIEEYKGEN
ncbi:MULTISPECIES: coproporphyrinogen-III oxidase family protein [Fusobacterium]|uniref:Coproporphyrinogen III oxidase family protein n=1 Tax=Fusobacterium hominis TaxID=2764326 RepID=A0A7G9GU94_9FUSO|nr:MULTISPECIES: coproporphyrinogen-III oxidase family protein [Fusobacterium]QNM14376.1 coproporphyrinogen III oxidase family protein [Fusobacterium hominis]